MAEETYRFVTNLAAGKRVQLFYLRSGVVAGNNVQKHRLPHVPVSLERWDELQREAPHGIYKSPFRIVRDYGTYLDLEWV